MKWKLANLAGIDVYVHWSFWILPGWMLMSAMSSSGFVAAVSTVAFLFAVFGCVVLHELGHALAARQFGIGTRDITLYPIGGVASLNEIPRSPVKELVIALAGPAVNVVIAGAILGGTLLAGVGYRLSFSHVPGWNFLVELMFVNIGLVVFNLLPAFPMDGGRVLRSFLAMQLPYERATAIAARIGKGMAVVLGLLGLFYSGSLVLVAMFVYLAAQAELSAVRSAVSQGPVYVVPPQWSSPDVSAPPGEGIVWLGEVTSRPGEPFVIRVTTRPGQPW
jgi:Zn-dependent protease